MRKITLTETQLEAIKDMERNDLFNNLIYVSVDLDEPSKEKLYKAFKNEVLARFGENAKMICHHMTISHVSKINDGIKKWCTEHQDATFTITATEIGFSDKACAVRIKTGLPTTQNYPHVTVAVNIDNNGKPVDSNFIQDFVQLPKPIDLCGKLVFHRSK